MRDRRTTERYRVWFPMTVITTGGEEGTAITYDVSATGLLMACAGRLAEGSEVTLRFRVGTDDPIRDVPCKILRVEERADEEGPWRFRMAVEFTAPQPDLETLLIAHADGS